MANFKKAFDVIIKNEGGWTVDNGGQTYKGISRKGWPTWPGWPLVDRYIKQYGKPRQNQFFTGSFGAQIDALVETFYYKQYWQRMYGDYIKVQAIADFIMDYAVNSGSAFININKALGARVTNNINEDSLKIINERPAFAYEVIYNSRKNLFLNLAKKPGLKQFKNGWLARVEKFPSQLKATQTLDVQALANILSYAV